MLNGICNKVRGDGDNHMRGMSCLLTGSELLPGNIQGGSDTPGGLGEQHLDRPGDQELPPEPAGDAHALRLAGIRRRGAGSRRPLDAHELRRREPADRADRRSVPDVRASSTAG